MAKAGYEMIFNYTRKQIKNSQDAVACALHWGMVSHGFLCVGEGETPPRKKVQGSEMLPEGWNSDDDVYALLYQQEDTSDTYLLKIICNGEDELLVHLARLRDDKVASCNVSCRQYTNKDLSTFKSAYKNLDRLQKHFKKDVLDAIMKPASPSGRRTQHTSREPDDDPLRVTPRCNLQHQRRSDWDEDHFAVGRGDLDPLAGGRGGGMFMDPRHAAFPGHGNYPTPGLPQGLPRGAVPPGARFDPYGPPDFSGPGPSRGRSGPDPDHLPPPGYDDMFM